MPTLNTSVKHVLLEKLETKFYCFWLAAIQPSDLIPASESLFPLSDPPVPEQDIRGILSFSLLSHHVH